MFFTISRNNHSQPIQSQFHDMGKRFVISYHSSCKLTWEVLQVAAYSIKFILFQPDPCVQQLEQKDIAEIAFAS